MWAGSKERGVALVESALTIVLLFTVFFAIIEASRVLSVQQAISNAAREGARLAVTPLVNTNALPPKAAIENQVGRFLTAASVQGAVVTVERPVQVNVNGIVAEYTRVQVQTTYKLITLPVFSALAVNLKGEALMRNETSP